MEISPDHVVFWRWGVVSLNLTIVTTWCLMGCLAFGAWLITRKVTSGVEIPRWQNALEAVVETIRRQLAETGLRVPDRYLGFLGTLFLFIAVSNLGIILPGYEPPTGSLSTTAALALCVFLAVPFFGIAEQGLAGYLRSYLQPTIIMLPFHIMSECSRTLALAIRLFGNVMSETMIAGILAILAPLFFPVISKLFGLLMGAVQAYIFAILATVFITAATGGEH